MHCLAQCHAKNGQGMAAMADSRVFQHSMPLIRNWTQVAKLTAKLTATHLNQSHLFISISQKKQYMSRCISPHATNFFAYRTVVLGFFKLNIKARHEIREFLNANLWSIHLIAFDIDWSWNFFTLHNFYSMLIEQLIDLEKVRTDNLKFRTDLRDRVMDGWSVTQ